MSKEIILSTGSMEGLIQEAAGYLNDANFNLKQWIDRVDIPPRSSDHWRNRSKRDYDEAMKLFEGAKDLQRDLHELIRKHESLLIELGT